MEYILIVIGIIIGSIISNIIFYVFSTSGTLRVDHTNPDKDIYRFEIDRLDKIGKKKRLIMKIDNHANLSQK